MPKLVLFAACEKAIVDQQTNVFSLLSLLENVNVQLIPGAVLPPNAIVPMSWAAVSIFERTPNDDGKTFEQRTAVFDSAGALVIQTPISPFEFKRDSDFHRIINNINGMPVGNAGRVSVKCYLRAKGGEWEEIATYPIYIKWQSTVN
jgi:hypothetical protein